MRNRPENQIEIRLTLIRHGATLSNKEGRYLGKTDEALSPEGIGMLKKAVTGGNYPTADLLFSGPMKRCLETAQILYPGQTPIFVPEWTEMDFGAFEGHNYQELSGDPAYQRWIDSGGTLAFPGGESRAAFLQRCCQALEQALQRQQHQIVAAVVHGGTIMAVLSALEEQQKPYFSWQAGHCEPILCTVTGTEPLRLRQQLTERS